VGAVSLFVIAVEAPGGTKSRRRHRPGTRPATRRAGSADSTRRRLPWVGPSVTLEAPAGV